MDVLISQLQDRSQWDPEEKADAAEELSNELIALQSIYGEDNVEVLSGNMLTDAISLIIRMPHEELNDPIRFSLRLPTGYPNTDEKPQLNLINRYLGPLPIDSSIQKEVEATFNPDGLVPWVRGEPLLFQGLDSAFERIRSWSETKEESMSFSTDKDSSKQKEPQDTTLPPQRQVDMSKLVQSEVISERKSEFLGHAIRISHPDEVPIVLAYILDSDKRIQRATHPTIYAWVCRTPDGVLHHDCDDDGEAAAGGRLAHLLQLLEIENALVVVTRWFGGVLLGPERFKHINRAARDALTKAGMV